MRSVRAKLEKFHVTIDKRCWRFRFFSCGAVGVVFVLFCESSNVLGVVDSLLLYYFIWASKSVLFVDVENIPKNSAKSMLATLACLFVYLCVYCACIVDSFEEREKEIQKS